MKFPTYSSSEAPALVDGSAMNVKKIGGILHQDKWAWLVRNNVLQIIALRRAHTICTYEFLELLGYENSCIKCVDELFRNNCKSLLLAVALESYRITANYISVFCLETKSVLTTIELSLHRSSAYSDFEKRLRGEEASHYFQIFQNNKETNRVALTCQSIATANIHNEEESKRVFAISWHSIIDEKNKSLLFDLNQWYKEEMPCAFEYNHQPNYLAGYILNDCCNGLQTWRNSTMMRYFNSVQQFEEHFYPISVFLNTTEANWRSNGCVMPKKPRRLVDAGNAAYRGSWLEIIMYKESSMNNLRSRALSRSERQAVIPTDKLQVTCDNTVAGNCCVSPTNTREVIKNLNGTKVQGSIHCVASSIMQTSK
uniref:Uncharacterized protein n=1 Tax=Glossina austeni TaxID=7395 RepID=A0A1A9V7L0_GLOAU